MRVVLVQLPVPNNRRANLPLALGYLKATADAAKFPGLEVELLDATAQNLGGEAFLTDAILARDPDLVGISLYTWNSSRSLQLAMALKERAPKIITLGGGPEINHDGDFILTSPYLDYVVQGEGELAFLELLRLLTSGHKEITPDNFRYAVHTHLPPAPANSLNFVSGKHQLKPLGPTVLSGPALEDVNLAPSAYLTGALEGHLGRFMSVELSRWCPSKCTFCYYGRQDVLRGGKRYFELERVRRELLFGMERGIEQIHFVEANFNTLPHLPQLYEMLKESGANRRMSFYAEMRGEAIVPAQAQLLAETNFNIVEVGLQSAVPEVLSRVKRKNNLPRLAQGVHNLREKGIEVFLDLILGLPGETPETFQRSLDWIEQNGLAPFDMFNLQILTGTQLKTEVEAGQHGIKWQSAPPYFVLETADLSFGQLAELRRMVMQARQDDPAGVAGLPQPGAYALVEPGKEVAPTAAGPVERVILDFSSGHIPNFDLEESNENYTTNDTGQKLDKYYTIRGETGNTQGNKVISLPTGPDLTALGRKLASQVTLWLKLGPVTDAALEAARKALADLSTPNPGGLWHLFVESDRAMTAAEKSGLTAAIRHEAGYLDRLAVFAQAEPGFQLFERWPSINFYEILPLDTALAQPDNSETIARVELMQSGNFEDWQRQWGHAAAFEGAGLALDSGPHFSPGRFKNLLKHQPFEAGQLWLSDLTLAAGQAFTAAEDLAGAEESLVYPLTAVVRGSAITYHAPGQERLQQAALTYRLSDGRRTVAAR